MTFSSSRSGPVQLGHSTVLTPLPCEFAFFRPALPKKIILLLHGYQQSGPWILNRLQSSLPEDAWVIAPSAPFAAPRKKNLENHTVRYRMGYSWYFYDPFEDRYTVDMKPAISYLRELLLALGAIDLPVTLIGYSQGGYLAPILAENLLNWPHSPWQVKRVIGLACEILEDEISLPLFCGTESVAFDLIHGAADEIVSVHRARASHQAVLARGGRGSFMEIAEVGHRIGPEMVLTLKNLAP